MKGISSEEEDIGIRKCRRNVFTLMYIGGTYERLVYNWYNNIFRMLAVMIVFLVVNQKKEI